MKLRARVMRREDPEQGPRPMIKLSDDSGMDIITYWVVIQLV